MKNELILDNWFFKTFKMDEKEIIIKEVESGFSINLMKDDLKPFKTPGTLQSNIAESMKIEPYFEENIKEFDYLEEYCLFLITEFPLEDQNNDYHLKFSYIDTMAQIFLNGVEIRNTFSAFIQHEFPLPNDLLKPHNTLIIIIYPPMSFVDKEVDLQDRVFVRKPTYNYGWDFAPRALLLGIGSAKIFIEELISFSDLYVWTKSISKENAEISISITLNSELEGLMEFTMEIRDLTHDESTYEETFSQNLSLGLNQLNRTVELKDFQLWWPSGLGNQHIYQLSISEKANKSTIKTKFGIRTIRLILHENGDNKFIFEINGKKIFAKGANWVPTDSLTNYSTKEKYRKLLSLAKKANFNMIRIWGGGVVENEIFYDLCDELGLMIWHDFQFACSIYPEHKRFLSIVEVEISHIIKRLRNHPSIVLWCGNNENEWIDFQHLTSSFREERQIGEKLHQLKKRLCSKLDPSRPYWRTSPWSPSAENSYEYDPNSMDEGNNHDWRVWHGVYQPNFEPPEFEEYTNNKAKFITEFGIQSLPSKQTIDRIFSERTQSEPNNIWEFHNCDINKIKVNMKKMGEPTNINEWILFTQAAQAFGMKYAVETWRARKFDTAGALIWQFNEPWPTICWSLVDYYNTPKIAYWFIKNTFQPLIIVHDPDTNNIVVVNDFHEHIKGILKIRTYNFKGQIKSKVDHQLLVKNNSKEIISLESLETKKGEFTWLNFTNNKLNIENIILPCDPIQINFPNSKIVAKFGRDVQILTLSSKEIGFLVHVPDELEPSDNYFHIIPNVPREIRLNQFPIENKLTISVWNHPKTQIPLEILK